MDKDIYTYSDGSTYEGEWKDKMRHGQGILTRPDGMRYEGEWANNKPNGQGTLTHPSGKERSGLWKDGKLITEQQLIEPKEDKLHELVISQKTRIQKLVEANQALKAEISALTNKVANLEGQTVQGDFSKEFDFTLPMGRTEEMSPLEKSVRSEKPIRKKSKIWLVVAAALLLLVVVIIANIGGEEEPASEVADIENTTPEPELASEPSSDPALESEEGTLGEKNAAKSAVNYLGTMPFSYSGLVEQLKFEGYTHEEAVYGVDRCGADWNEQAAKSAQNYLDISSFSRTELIAQLEFEGFTRQQAEYGVQSVGY